MAVTTEDLLIQLQVDGKEASKALVDIKNQLKDLNSTQKETAKSSKQTSDGLNGIGAASLKLSGMLNVASQAANLLSGTIGQALDEAKKAQTAFEKFSLSLQFFGGDELSKSAENLNKLADSMEAASGVDGDALLALAGRGAALGLTNKEIEQLITGATDLATIMGGDVSQAGEALLNSVNGQTKALAKYVPEVNNLKNGQLEAGDAIALTATKLSGLGAKFGETAQGIDARFNAVVGKVFEELGKTIDQSFNLINGKKLTINFLNELVTQIDNARPYVVAFFKTIGDFDWQAIAIAVSSIATAFYVLSGGLKAAAIAGAKALIPLGIIAAKFIAITLAIGGTIALIEIVARNFGNLSAVASFAFEKIGQAILKARIAFNEFTGDTAEADALKKRLEESKKATEELGKTIDFGISGRVFNSIVDSVSNFSKNVDDAKNPVDSLGNTLQKMGDKGVNAIKPISDAAKQALDALKQMASVQQPRNDIDSIKLKASQDRLKVEQEYQKLVDSTSNKQIKAQADLYKSQALSKIAADEQFQITEKYSAALNDIAQKNKDLELSIRNQGSLQQDIIQNNLNASLAAIEKERQEKIKQLGGSNPAIEAEFKKRMENEKKLAEEAAKNAPSRAFEAPKKMGEEVGKAISGQMSEGIMGSVAGISAGIGAAVSAAQAVVDMIPNMLGGIANLITSITDLPLKILEGVTNILNGITGFLQNFISNIGQMVTGILEGIVNLVTELPKLVVGFITQIPKVLLGIIEKIPDIVMGLVQGLVEGAPMIALGLIEFLIKDAPKIAIKMVKVLAIELPIAIVKGIVNAIKNIFSSLGRLLTGGSVFKDVGQSIAKGFGTGLKKLSGIGSKLFEVKDLAADAAGPALEKGQQLIEQINEAGENAWGWITGAWKWVYENIIKPIIQLFMFAWEGLKIVGNFVVSIFKGAWESLKSAAYFVRDVLMAVWEFAKSIFQVIIDAFMAVWNFVVTLFDDPIQAFKNLWEDVKNIFSGIIDAFANFFGGLWDAIKGYGARIWEGFQEAVGGVINMFTAMGRWIWEGIISVVGGIGSFFSDLGGKIWAGFTGGTDKIKNFFKELGQKIWDGLAEGLEGIGDFFGDIGGGVGDFFGDVGDAIGSLFNQGGIVGGVALTSGDSPRNDIIPAWLSPGEAVIPRSLMAKPEISDIVNKILSRQGIGELSPQQSLILQPAQQQQLIPQGVIGSSNVVNSYNFEINMAVENRDPMDENFLRNRLIPRMQDELKRASMEGKFVISQKGIRNV